MRAPLEAVVKARQKNKAQVEHKEKAVLLRQGNAPNDGRGYATPPKKSTKMTFDNQKLDFTGVHDRRGWYNASHRTPVGAATSEYIKYTAPSLAYRGAKKYAKIIKKVF